MTEKERAGLGAETNGQRSELRIEPFGVEEGMREKIRSEVAMFEGGSGKTDLRSLVGASSSGECLLSKIESEKRCLGKPPGVEGVETGNLKTRKPCFSHLHPLKNQDGVGRQPVLPLMMVRRPFSQQNRIIS